VAAQAAVIVLPNARTPKDVPETWKISPSISDLWYFMDIDFVSADPYVYRNVLPSLLSHPVHLQGGGMHDPRYTALKQIASESRIVFSLQLAKCSQLFEEIQAQCLPSPRLHASTKLSEYRTSSPEYHEFRMDGVAEAPRTCSVQPLLDKIAVITIDERAEQY
jgi:hypothetical protein